MTETRTIAIVGATGKQGGGLARAILDHPEQGFRARVLTRKPGGDAARALAARGAEVVQHDLDDPPSVERAFAGAHGAFCVTNFWEHQDVDREMAQAGAMARAARAAGLHHAIWSTLEDSRTDVPLADARMPTLHGRWKVPHFDGKAEADRHFAASGIPTTCLVTSFYWDNFIHFGLGPRRAEGGGAVLALPLGSARFPGIAAEDIGRCALGIFREGPARAGPRIGIAGEMLTGAEMARQMGDAMGTAIQYHAVPFDTFRGLGFPGADDLGNMFQWNTEFADGFRARRSVARSRELNPGMQDFRAWLADHHHEIQIQD